MATLNKLRNKIAKASTDELLDLIYRDELTGIFNRRAFMESQMRCVVIADLDSLKYLNDSLGHRIGDLALQDLAGTLISRFSPDRVFRLSGDEFVVTGEDPRELREGLDSLQRQFPVFSYGMGCDLDIADQELRINKRQREAEGLRAPRGVRPPWAERYESRRNAV